VKQVAEVTPAAPAPEPVKKTVKQPLQPVIISDLPTKKPVAPVNFVDNDEKVFKWYSGRSAGERYTRQEAASQIGVSIEELDNSIVRLQKKLLGERLLHFVD
jgi:hypothetical protein